MQTTPNLYNVTVAETVIRRGAISLYAYILEVYYNGNLHNFAIMQSVFEFYA